MIARWLLAIVLSSVVCAGLGYWRGIDRGELNVHAAEDDHKLAAISNVLDGYKSLIHDANQAGETLGHQIARRQAADDQTTQEFKDALAKTRNLRVHCEFGPDVMRKLRAARDRAANAAASGFTGTVPAAPRDTGG